MYMSQGLGIGFMDEMKNVDKDILKAIPSDFDINARTHLNNVLDDRSLEAAAFARQTSFRNASGQVVVQVPLYQTARNHSDCSIQSGFPPTAAHWVT